MGSLLADLEPLRQAMRALFEGREVVLAYLYGSQARGDSGPLSDVDIAVGFAPHVSPADRFDRVLRLNVELGDLLRRPDVATVDVSGASPLLRHRIYLHGHLLHCPDDRVRVRFATTALRDYVDTEPLRRIKRHYLVRRLQEQG